MEFVEPIRDRNKIAAMKKLLAGSPRDHLLFVIGINTAYRVSDLLSMRYSDVMDSNGNLFPYFKLKETKTKKNSKVTMTKGVQKSLTDYIKDNYRGNPDDYLFQSRKRDKDGNSQPINRKSAWRIIQEAAKQLGLNDIGSHSLRKTFAYHQYKSGTDIVLIQDMLNHSNPSVTLRYIGITQDEKDRAIKALDL
ncbi:tyrosine-type recombinase/integrase [Peribacillus frigoritolerans]|uniref:Tyrosine-type recombinase/integrase n=1 Tax=Peribacillus frigoritolerans TaxID=450367 RepID=A0AAJ1QQP3_9BACI|nr:tyrosine-type recombinase/integrase [Peribacillus frigoritolerans]MDM5285663.1 tyrosine-type recombinase/integrase [Peribacillus frigoritolerans]